MATFQSLATSKELNQQQGHLDDSWLECSICLEALTRNHKVLPCQHTFCLPCLKDLASSTKAKEQITSDREPQDPSSEKQTVQQKGFLCPECRANVDISLDKLPSNVILNRILEGRKKGVAMIAKPEHNVGKVHVSKDYKAASHRKPPNSTQTEKTSATQCDKYKAFSEAAQALKEQSTSKIQVGPKIKKSFITPGEKKPMTSSDVMHSDMKPPSIPPPPIPGNLSTNPFVQMVVSETVPSSSNPNLEKENVKESLVKPQNIFEKEKISAKQVLDVSNQSVGKHNQNNQNNTAHYELLIGQNNPWKTGSSTIPTLPPRTLSIVSPTPTSKFSSQNTTYVQGASYINIEFLLTIRSIIISKHCKFVLMSKL